MAKTGFKGAATINREEEARRAQEAFEKLEREKAEAQARYSAGKKPRADIEDGLNVLMVLPSFSENNSSFIRLTLAHYNPFFHVCSRPAPIFNPNDPTKIVYSTSYQSGPDSDVEFRCQQCISGWAIVSKYMKENGIKRLNEVDRNVEESKLYSYNKAGVYGVFVAVNLSSFFSMEGGKTIPTLDQKMYKAWFPTFMDVVMGKAEAPEDMPDKLKLQATAGLQVMRVNQDLSVLIKQAVDTRSEEETTADEEKRVEQGLEAQNPDGPIYPLLNPSKYLLSIVRGPDPKKKFTDISSGEDKFGFSFTVNCFKVGVKDKWEIPDEFLEMCSENPIDLYDIKPSDASLESKASAYQPLNEEELAELCLKYGMDIINNVKVATKVKADGSNGGEASAPSNQSAKTSKHDFDDMDDDDEDTDALLASAKAQASAKPVRK